MTKAIILAAGLGTRLRPYTTDKPKTLVTVAGKSLLRRQIEVLEFCGVTEIVIVVGHKWEQFQGHRARLVLNERYEQTNMLSSLFAAEAEFDGDVIVSYGDIVYSHHILQSLLMSRENIAVSIDLNWRNYWSMRMAKPEMDVESLRLDRFGKILEIGSKPNSLDEVDGQYMGLFKLSPIGWATFSERYHTLGNQGESSKAARDKMSMTCFLQHLVGMGVAVMSVPSRSPWVEVDSASDLNLRETRERLEAIERDLR